MINLAEKIERYKLNGFDEIYASAKVSQDILIKAIANSKYKSNITIKGGVVMYNLTKNMRRATIDIDIDLVHLSLGKPNIIKLFSDLSDKDIKFVIDNDSIEELRHEDYKGKRVSVSIEDNFKNIIMTKIDIGVHADFDILLEEITFDTNKDKLSLLVNSKEQIFVEKIIPLIKHGTGTRRHKDLFDLYWLIKNGNLDKIKIMFIFEKKLFNNSLNNVYNYKSLLYNLKRVLTSRRLQNALNKNADNWLDISINELIYCILGYLEQLTVIEV